MRMQVSKIAHLVAMMEFQGLIDSTMRFDAYGEEARDDTGR